MHKQHRRIVDSERMAEEALVSLFAFKRDVAAGQAVAHESWSRECAGDDGRLTTDEQRKCFREAVRRSSWHMELAFDWERLRRIVSESAPIYTNNMDLNTLIGLFDALGCKLDVNFIKQE